jgi:ribosome-binding protein aMBF1 (putative translation factor)
MSRMPPPLSEQIRVAIDASGMSRYRVCKEIGLSQSMMSRFMSGQAGLSMEVVDKLGEFLGLEIAAKKQSANVGTFKALKGQKVNNGKRIK